MGLAVSQQILPKPSLENKRTWCCDKCSTDNPQSVYPICVACGQKYGNIEQYPSNGFWRCDACSFSSNRSTFQYCNNCSRKRVTSNRQETYAANARITSAMRPMSVSVRRRRETDESDAEKLIRNVISFCKQHNITFIDDQFPPSLRSLGTTNTDRTIQWLSLANIAPSTEVDSHFPWTVCNSPEPHDIHQGELGDCWLMAALALITERPQMLQHILLTKKINQEGIYAVRICHNGIWKPIIIDEYFPCTRYNTLAYSRAARRQLYVPLIEKACAKLFGSYANLSGGTTAEGLQLLTGAPCDRIDLHPTNETLDFDVIWAKLLSACESKLLIGASTGCSDVDQQEYEIAGLNPNHAFTVLIAKALPVGDGRFLLLRDPHGTSNYLEDTIPISVRSHLRPIHNEMPNSTGIFWITWLKFLHFFDSVTISTYVSDHFDIREESQFTRSSIDPVPAYYFTVPKTSLITVSLVYHRRERKGDNRHSQSFVLCDIEEETTNVGMKQIILESRRGTFTYWSGSLQPGAYVIIPFSASFWKASNDRKDDKTRSYTLVIHSSTQLDGVLLNEPPSLLADCLIAATIKFCNNPKKSDSSVLYVTPRHFDAKLIVVENQLSNYYLTFNMTITDAGSIRHSRHAYRTLDCIPPRHRQLVCVLEWNHRRGEVAHMSYVTSQQVSRGWHDTHPTIITDKHDLHSPRPF